MEINPKQAKGWRMRERERERDGERQINSERERMRVRGGEDNEVAKEKIRIDKRNKYTSDTNNSVITKFYLQ